MIIALQTLYYFRKSLIGVLIRFLYPYYESVSIKLKNSESFSEEDDEELEVYSEFHEEKGVIFFPPVYVQRYAAVIDCLTDERWFKKIEKVVDLGYNDMSFINYLKEVPGVQTILGVDMEPVPIKDSLFQLDNDGFCQDPVEIILYQGNAADPDYRLIGCDAVVSIEMIEHMLPHDLERLIHTVFGFIKPMVAIFTTPNADFNVLFKNLEKNGLRRMDHMFEWTREQFNDWCSNIVLRYPEYTVVSRGIGPGPPETKHLGCCSQMAIFVSKDYHKQKTLDVNCLALVPQSFENNPINQLVHEWEGGDHMPETQAFPSDHHFLTEVLSTTYSVTNSSDSSASSSRESLAFSNKLSQCNMDLEVSKNFLMFNEEKCNTVLMPRSGAVNKIYDIEDVVSRLNCSTYHVKKFSKISQNLIEKSKMEASIRKEVVDEIKTLSKQLTTINADIERKFEKHKCIWNNTVWGYNAPYWNQYYKVIKQFKYPSQIQSEVTSLIDLLTDEINSIVDAKSEGLQSGVKNVIIPLRDLMPAVQHITDDIEKIKDLLEWNGYEVQDDMTIHTKCVDVAHIMADESRGDSHVYGGQKATDFIRSMLGPYARENGASDDHRLHSALGEKVRKLRTLTMTEKDIKVELDRVICRLIRLALRSGRKQSSSPPCQWLQYKLLDLLVLSEKAMERRRNKYIKEYLTNVLERGKEHKKNTSKALEKYKRDITGKRIEDKYRVFVDDVAIDEANPDADDKSGTSNCLMEEYSNMEVSLSGDDDELDGNWHNGDNEDFRDYLFSNVDKLDTILSESSNVKGTSINNDSMKLGNDNSGVDEKYVRIKRKPRKSKQNLKLNKKTSRQSRLNNTVIKECIDRYSNIVTKPHLRKKWSFEKPNIVFSGSENQDSIDCSISVSEETENLLEEKPINNDISETKEGLIIQIITESTEENIALSRTIGTDADIRTLDEVKNDLIVQQEVAIESIFLSDINEPSTSKGVRHCNIDTQCNTADLHPTCSLSSMQIKYLLANEPTRRSMHCMNKYSHESQKIEGNTKSTSVSTDEKENYNSLSEPSRNYHELSTRERCLNDKVEFYAIRESNHIVVSSDSVKMMPVIGIKIKDSDNDINESDVLAVHKHQYVDLETKTLKAVSSNIITKESEMEFYKANNAPMINYLPKPENFAELNSSKILVNKISSTRTVSTNLSSVVSHVHSYKERKVSEDVIYQGKWSKNCMKVKEKSSKYIRNKSSLKLADQQRFVISSPRLFSINPTSLVTYYERHPPDKIFTIDKKPSDLSKISSNRVTKSVVSPLQNKTLCRRGKSLSPDKARLNKYDPDKSSNKHSCGNAKLSCNKTKSSEDLLVVEKVEYHALYIPETLKVIQVIENKQTLNLSNKNISSISESLCIAPETSLKVIPSEANTVVTSIVCKDNKKNLQGKSSSLKSNKDTKAIAGAIKNQSTPKNDSQKFKRLPSPAPKALLDPRKENKVIKLKSNLSNKTEDVDSKMTKSPSIRSRSFSQPREIKEFDQKKAKVQPRALSHPRAFNQYGTPRKSDIKTNSNKSAIVPKITITSAESKKADLNSPTNIKEKIINSQKRNITSKHVKIVTKVSSKVTVRSNGSKHSLTRTQISNLSGKATRVANKSILKKVNNNSDNKENTMKSPELVVMKEYRQSDSKSGLRVPLIKKREIAQKPLSDIKNLNKCIGKQSLASKDMLDLAQISDGLLKNPLFAPNTNIIAYYNRIETSSGIDNIVDLTSNKNSEKSPLISSDSSSPGSLETLKTSLQNTSGLTEIQKRNCNLVQGLNPLTENNSKAHLNSVNDEIKEASDTSTKYKKNKAKGNIKSKLIQMFNTKNHKTKEGKNKPSFSGSTRTNCQDLETTSHETNLSVDGKITEEEFSKIVASESSRKSDIKVSFCNENKNNDSNVQNIVICCTQPSGTSQSKPIAVVGEDHTFKPVKSLSMKESNNNSYDLTSETDNISFNSVSSHSKNSDADQIFTLALDLDDHMNSVTEIFERKNLLDVQTFAGRVPIQAFSGFSMNVEPVRAEPTKLVDPTTGSLTTVVPRQAASEELLVAGMSYDTIEDVAIPEWLFAIINTNLYQSTESRATDPATPSQNPSVEPDSTSYDPEEDELGIGAGAGAGDGRGIHSDTPDSSGQGSSVNSSTTNSALSTPPSPALTQNLSSFAGPYEPLLETPSYGTVVSHPADEARCSSSTVEAGSVYMEAISNFNDLGAQLSSTSAGEADISSTGTDGQENND